jgi:hypothetical protein
MPDVVNDELVEDFAAATLQLLDAATCTSEMLATARQDAIARRLDGAAFGMADDFASGIKEYVDEGWSLADAARVCPEAMLAGYWTARRALGTESETYEWTDEQQEHIATLVADIAIENVVIRTVPLNDETDLLRAIAPGVEDDDLSYPMIGFDTGFTAAVVEHNLAHAKRCTP